MPPITRFRLPLGAVLLGLAAQTACGPKDQAQGPRLVAPGLAAASTPAPAESAGSQPGLPVMHVQAPSVVTTGTSGHEASVVGDPDLRYEWTIQGGAFEGGSRGSQVRWTAGAPGDIRLFCEGTNAAGKKTVILTHIASEPQASIERFVATPAVITQGHAAKLSWAGKEIKTLILDPGGQDVAHADGPGIEVKPQETATYTLTATNAAGDSVTKETQVKVVPPPAISAFSGQGAISFGQSVTIVGAYSGGKAELRRGADVVATSTDGSIQAVIPGLKAEDSFTLVVTNEAGDSVARSLNFSVAPPPAK